MSGKLEKVIGAVAAVAMATASDKEAKTEYQYQKVKGAEYSEKVRQDSSTVANKEPTTSEQK